MTAIDMVSSEGPYDVTPILHSRYFVLPVSAAILGTLIGVVRGSRRASLRFLAENAHRPPRTVQGWYFYNKTKNYRRMAAGLQEGGVNAIKLGVAALVWVGVEDGLERCGQPWAEAREMGAGVGTASIFAAVCKLPRCLSMQDADDDKTGFRGAQDDRRCVWVREWVGGWDCSGGRGHTWKLSSVVDMWSD